MMYIEKTNESKVNLMGMDLDQATALASMIRGAGLPERSTSGWSSWRRVRIKQE